MSERDEVYARYRPLLIKSYIVISAIIFILEIAGWIFTKPSYPGKVLFDRRFFNFVLIPTLINAGLIALTSAANFSPKTKEEHKNAATIYCLGLIALNTACAHSYFDAAACCLCIPIMVSSVYESKKVLRRAALMSLASLTICAAVTFYFSRPGDKQLLPNCLIALTMIITSYMISSIIIMLEQETALKSKHSDMQCQTLEQQIQRDQMTGLFNQSAFYKRLQIAAEGSAKNGTDLVLAVIDLDNFKRVNDNYGHERGNEVLVELARGMEKYCAATDNICRYGGDEFAIIFNNRNLADSLEIVKNISDYIQNAKFEFMEESISFSCGLCSYKNEYTYLQFFNAADKAVYAAKKAGRNRIELT